MKKILFLISLLALIWQCSDKNPLDIAGSSVQLKSPTEKPTISRSDYTSNGNFLPGYQNGKIRSDRIILDWPNSTDGSFLCYKVYRNNVEKSTITDQTLNSYLDSNLVQNTYYNYRIVTMNKSGMFKSDTIKLKTPLFQPPTNLAYQVRSTTSINLFWENMAESASSFYIDRKLNSEPHTAYQQIGTSLDTFYIDNSVTNLEQYSYRIRAYNNYESTGYSYDLYVYVNYILNTPNIYSVNQISGTRSVFIEWFENSNAEDGFLIYRRKLGQNLQFMGTVSTNVTEYFDHDTTNSLMIDSTYYYSVRAYNALNTDTSNYSTELGITISEPSTALERILKYYILGGPEQPDAGDDFGVYYYSNQSIWVLIRTIQYDQVYSWTYFEDIINYADAMHSGFQIKFEQIAHSGATYDNYYLDDVELVQGITTIFSDDFNGGSISFSNWPYQNDVIIDNTYFQSSPRSLKFEGSGTRAVESLQIPW